MKKIFTCGIVVLFVGLVSSCASKKTTYQSAYDKAIQEEEAELATKEEPLKQEDVVGGKTENEEFEDEFGSKDNAPVTQTQNVATSRWDNSLKKYSVVGGCYANQDGALSVQSAMRKKGYDCTILFDDTRRFYRVILSSFATRSEAVANMNSLKRADPALFGDIWVMEKSR